MIRIYFRKGPWFQCERCIEGGWIWRQTDHLGGYHWSFMCSPSASFLRERGIALDWVSVSPARQIHLLKSNPQYDVLGGRAFGSELSHEGKALMNGISATESSFVSSAMWGHTQEVGSLIRQWICWHLDLELASFQTVRNKFLWCFVTAAWRD